MLIEKSNSTIEIGEDWNSDRIVSNKWVVEGIFETEEYRIVTKTWPSCQEGRNIGWITRKRAISQ